MATGTQTIHGQPGRYNSVLPTLNNGQGAAIAVDINGRIITSSTGGGTAAISDGGTSPLASMMVGGEFLTSAPTLTNGQSQTLLLDSKGNLDVTLGTTIAGEDIADNRLFVEQHNSYLNIVAGQATTTVKSGAGFLHSITFNSAATATNVTTVYDNTAASGTVVAIPAATTATIPVTLTYDVAFTIGLTIITATANGSNMTVSYR